MDWISITTNCFAATNAVAKTTILLQGLLREMRELRIEIDQLLVELHSLDTTLDLLKEDAQSFPPDLSRRTPVMVENCTSIVNELGGYISLISSYTLSPRDKKARWIKSRKPISRLQLSLQGHKAVLGLALDLAAQTAIRRLETYDGIRSHRLDGSPDMVASPTEVAWLPPAVEDHLRSNPIIKLYLDDLEAHAAASGVPLKSADRLVLSRATSAGDCSDPPDSAVEIPDSPTIPAMAAPYSRYNNPPIHEVDESFPELPGAAEPPPPPPKGQQRASASPSKQHVAAAQRPLTSYHPHPHPHRRRPSTASTDLSPDSSGPSMFLGVDGQVKVPRRTTSLRLIDVEPIDFSTFDWDNLGRAPSDSQSLHPGGRKGLGRLFGHVRNKLSTATLAERDSLEHRPSTSAPSASTNSTNERLGLRRTASQRLSTTLKSIAMPLNRSGSPELPAVAEPNTVFGVSLNKSMLIASATVRTRHGGDGGGTSSRRFPLCVLKCVSYVRAKGLDTVDIFSRPEDEELAMALQREFGTGPRYGEDMDLDMFGPGPAAEVIVRFLAQLRKPLVPENVARRWVKLSRRATVAGMAAPREEECIDFWEEALGGMRGPGRNVLKLLLNLWGEVADHAHTNEMTAERLAGGLVRPLMHTPGEYYNTELMLGLAFMIRKRSEYSKVLKE